MSCLGQFYHYFTTFPRGLVVIYTILLKGETGSLPLLPLSQDFFKNKKTPPKTGFLAQITLNPLKPLMRITTTKKNKVVK